MDQLIPHMAIQCGDKHVIPLCQALLNYLTGRNTALFLPLYALTTLTDDRIQQHFAFHETWVKSLSSVDIAPTISCLDQIRNEYFDNGTVLVRSTREWAASLSSPDGKTPALCDVVNGTSDHKTYPLAPRHYLEAAQQHWREYKSRLYPPRYRDNIQGLPDVIHVTTSIQSNVSFLEQMLSASVWHQCTTLGSRSNQTTRYKYYSSSPYTNAANIPPSSLFLSSTSSSLHIIIMMCQHPGGTR